MTWAGWMRRCARRMAMRRISWTDQRMRGVRLVAGLCPDCFWGCGGVRVVADGGQHGEGQHDERDVAVPAVPGAGLVVVEAELVLRGLEAVLDGPAVPLDLDQRLDRRPGRAPGGEVGQLAVGDVAADQQAPRPKAGEAARRTRPPRGQPVRDRPSRAAAGPWCPHRPTGAARPMAPGLPRSPRRSPPPPACPRS